MKLYVWTKGVKKVTISSDSGDCSWEVMKVSNSSSSSMSTSTSRRRISYRSIIPTVLFLCVVLPLIFIRTAFLALETTPLCSSIECIGFGWKFGSEFFGGSETTTSTRVQVYDSLKLTIEITKELIEAEKGNFYEGSSSSTFNDLVADVISNRHDIKTFASKTKDMVLKMEHKVQSAREHELLHRHLASYGIPKSMHCLCLRLAEEYSVNAFARSPLPSPEFVYRLANSSYQHIALLTDNVLAACVVVSSTVTNSDHPEKLVFHIVTDRKTYAPMYAWFALHPATPAVVEVKGLHQLDWPLEVTVRVKEMLEIHRSTRKRFYTYNIFKEWGGDDLNEDNERRIKTLRPRSLSLMDQLWIYLPELFPELNRIILLHDDTLVQHDLSPLWELDLNGKVNGAVVSNSGDDPLHYNCSGNRYGDYLNFSRQEVFTKFNINHCAWLSGMNIFDLRTWRRSNITDNYHHWLKLNLNSGFELWLPGTYPPALVAFEGHVHPIDPSWHKARLGQQALQVDPKLLEAAAVLHFSGPAKPWLEIGSRELQNLWNRHINYSNEFVSNCKF
ncbi:hypothetical protein IFM89_013633 [Coptis chinensis]|uniref:Hexosyltransferase n=1 Tax=Coptis chinensis TaxID=261450 RepID=A0A835IQ23_9MAGN|nr:hypothetical protein IFM89_013633 [Coptis chinensis]